MGLRIERVRNQISVQVNHKGQVMVDFIAEIPQKSSQLVGLSEEGWWILYIDRAFQVSGSKVGLILQSPTGEQLEQAIWLGFLASNNEVEYEVILSGLSLALAQTASKLEICSDSQLVVGQIHGEYEAKDGCMAQYLSKVRDTLDKLSK